MTYASCHCDGHIECTLSPEQNELYHPSFIAHLQCFHEIFCQPGSNIKTQMFLEIKV